MTLFLRIDGFENLSGYCNPECLKKGLALVYGDEEGCLVMVQCCYVSFGLEKVAVRRVEVLCLLGIISESSCPVDVGH